MQIGYKVSHLLFVNAFLKARRRGRNIKCFERFYIRAIIMCNHRSRALSPRRRATRSWEVKNVY